MVEWSSVGHSLALVVKNDLYYIEDVSRKSPAKQLTTSGQERTIFNGIADWLYEGNFKALYSRTPIYGTPLSRKSGFPENRGFQLMK